MSDDDAAKAPTILTAQKIGATFGSSNYKLDMPVDRDKAKAASNLQRFAAKLMALEPSIALALGWRYQPADAAETTPTARETKAASSLLFGVLMLQCETNAENLFFGIIAPQRRRRVMASHLKRLATPTTTSRAAWRHGTDAGTYPGISSRTRSNS
jgi:hypothetical protein